jgi:dTDP-4-dehydrorhamnose reductase
MTKDQGLGGCAKSMRIVITGSQGQLGAELCRQYAAEGSAGLTQAGSEDVSESGSVGSEPGRVASEPGRVAPVVGLDLPDFDLTDRDCVLTTLLRLRPEVIINTAAFTRVDKAEQEPALCRRVNVDGVKHLVEACRELDCTLVQISTDYVFGRDAGRTAPYRETDEPGPLGIYGQTKLDGERLAAQWSKHFVVRTCGLYGRLGPRSAGNFVETMLRLGAAGRSLRVVDDQHCTPTNVSHLAQAIRFLARTTAYGTYHVVNAGETTWYELAREILRQAGLDVPIEPITTAEYRALAPRPAYSVLDTHKYHALDRRPAMASWQDALTEYLTLPRA